MRRFALITAVLLAFLCLPCAASPDVDNAVSEVPFTFEQGHIVVPAQIKDGLAVDVILATGEEYSIIDAALLDKYKLPAYYTGAGMITGSSADR